MLKPLRHNTEIKIPHFFYTDIFDSISWINVGYLYIFIRVYMNYTYFWAYGVTYPSTNDMDKMRMNLFCLLLSQFSNQDDHYLNMFICSILFGKKPGLSMTICVYKNILTYYFAVKRLCIFYSLYSFFFSFLFFVMSALF